MRKEEILQLLEEGISEEQNLVLGGKKINIGRLDGVVYDPRNHDDPFSRF